MVEEAKCEEVGKIRNNLFAKGCVGLLSWLGACLAQKSFGGFFFVKKRVNFRYKVTWF